MKCPCCKVINTLNETLKHPSLTSIQTALRTWKSFIEMDKAKLMVSIYPCVKHGNEDGYASFINEANTKKNEIIRRTNEEKEKRAIENINRMFHMAARRILS